MDSNNKKHESQKKRNMKLELRKTIVEKGVNLFSNSEYIVISNAPKLGYGISPLIVSKEY